MPLVRISLMKGRPESLGKKVGDAVYRTMVETINVPAKDNSKSLPNTTATA
jgi:hypothetical protein